MIHVSRSDRLVLDCMLSKCYIRPLSCIAPPVSAFSQMVCKFAPLCFCNHLSVPDFSPSRCGGLFTQLGKNNKMLLNTHQIIVADGLTHLYKPIPLDNHHAHSHITPRPLRGSALYKASVSELSFIHSANA